MASPCFFSLLGCFIIFLRRYKDTSGDFYGFSKCCKLNRYYEQKRKKKTSIEKSRKKIRKNKSQKETKLLRADSIKNNNQTNP